jgi:hypothetical protein
MEDKLKDPRTLSRAKIWQPKAMEQIFTSMAFEFQLIQKAFRFIN